MARRDVLVLCYHGVHPEALHGEVTPEALRAQLSFVARRGYRFATFTEAVLGADSGRVAAVTFDDGIASAVEHGLPVLAELGAPGTMFLTVTMLGWGGRLDADAAVGLADRGWEIGSHTMTHPVLTNVDPATLRVELADSKAELERLTGRPCAAVSYPTGRCDARVVTAAADAGYAAGATLEGATSVAPGPLAWPRVGVRGDDSLRVFKVKCSRIVRRARSSWLRGPVGKAASAAGRARRG
ncbi:MAG TPA: polysaccharide deacetylase family protein [Gaiellaceae bacterium]|nr:polysaccharide deacetylase family protein [Gaiellaceae bacterium]